jgi:hypothetical protein
MKQSEMMCRIRNLDEQKSSPAQKRCLHKIRNLLKLKEFKEGIREIRKKWNIPEAQGFSGIKKHDERKKREDVFYAQANEKGNADKLVLDIFALCDKFNLTKTRYFQYLAGMIIDGEVNSGLILSTPRIRQPWNKTCKEFELWIRVYGDTTTEDMKQIWHEIKTRRLQSTLPEYGVRYKTSSPKQNEIVSKIFEEREKNPSKSYEDILKDMKGYFGKTKPESTYLSILVRRFKKSLYREKPPAPWETYLDMLKKQKSLRNNALRER